MHETLTAPAVRLWCAAAADALAAHQAEIDALNVFPVPDGDTGTNLALTLRAAADAVADVAPHAGIDGAPADAATVLHRMSRAAVLGARGNSGVIVAQILRGLAGSVEGDACDGAGFARALRVAADHAYAAVAEPVEGTILSVVRAAADEAHVRAQDDATLAEVLAAAVTGAEEALRRTPAQLGVLARAGVVDAGGRGLVILLTCLARVVDGAAAAGPSEVVPGDPPDGTQGQLGEAALPTDGAGFAYEVQFLLTAPDLAVADLRAALSRLGDSVAVAGTGDGEWNVHVHVDDIGAAVEAALDHGRPHGISVRRFADQVIDALQRPAHRAGPLARGHGVAVVAVAPGPGLSHLFAGEGVHVVEGGPGANPSTADVLKAVRDSGAAQVVLLPNASQVSGVAEAAAAEARAEHVEVAVVPTRSPVQGLAAVAVHDPGRQFGEDVIAMAEAAAATRWAEITIAQREALTSVGPCQAGDVLGLIGGEVVEVGVSVRVVARSVVDRLLGAGGELVTILVGAGVDPDVVEDLTAHIDVVAPLAEISVFDGGQPHYPLLIGVE